MNAFASIARQPGPALFTADEFLRMDALGLLEDRRAELVDGRIWEQGLSGWDHGSLIALLAYLLTIAARGCGVATDVNLRLSDDRVRRPDLVLASPDDVAAMAIMPHEVALAIEVSITTRDIDLVDKALEYSEAGIEMYWVLDVENDGTHVLSMPGPDGYARHDQVPFSAPLAVPGGGAIIIKPPSATPPA